MIITTGKKFPETWTVLVSFQKHIPYSVAVEVCGINCAPFDTTFYQEHSKLYVKNEHFKPYKYTSSGLHIQYDVIDDTLLNEAEELNQKSHLEEKSVFKNFSYHPIVNETEWQTSLIDHMIKWEKIHDSTKLKFILLFEGNISLATIIKEFIDNSTEEEANITSLNCD